MPGGLPMSDGEHGDRPSEEFAIRMIIVSPVRLYREALASALAAKTGIGEVATCEQSVDALRLARRVVPHVLLLDTYLTGSSTVARLFTRELPQIKIVALALPETVQRVVAYVEAGVVGYLPREGSIEDLIAVVQHVEQGQTLCSPVIAAGLMHRVADLACDNGSRRAQSRLTARELEVADHIARGMSNRAIAASLGIELCTVKNHVHNILDKLGATQRSDVATCLGD
jgi:DNA-binding NarL/FixJ family response regulator